ncbi:FecR family protein [Flavobacterium xanthum]|uniref:FecR family protein n=2 Tax=Flavobacterium xanthum TaxID=69322 RepID=A0A1M7KYH0_9FLAO|nr:FecR family protein [Flavobacterium xanthum]
MVFYTFRLSYINAKTIEIMIKRKEKKCVRYLASEMSKADRSLFEIELSLDDNLKSIYEDYKMIWVCYPTTKETIITPSFKEIEGTFINHHTLKNNRFNFRKPLLYAFASLSLCFLGLFFYLNTPQSMVLSNQRVAERGHRLSFTLPDNSVVTLNSGGSVKYADNFKDQRDIWLIGEAFFKVTKNVNSPFTVHTVDLDVQVLGTEFSVNSETINKTISLKQGKVKVSLKENNDEIYLMPSEELIFNTKTKTVLKRRFDIEKTMDWKDNILLLKDEKLQDAKEKIERFYGVNFIVKNNEIANLRITGSFKDQNINEFISSLEFITNCKIIQSKPNYYLITKSDE